jgi:catechol 2,3-dioxygenase-like lactoylglutathione lyase family enzyme
MSGRLLTLGQVPERLRGKGTLEMPYHHLAFASHNTEATDCFYREAMGFTLSKVEVGPTPTGGWSKHFFYDTGDGSMIAFWEIHDEQIPSPPTTAISTGLGLPEWVNHVAFDAPTREDLDEHRSRLNRNGYDVLEVDHGWCISIYMQDPNGIMVEFCHSTREFTADEVAEAAVLLRATAPPASSPPPSVRGFAGEGQPLHSRGV